MDNCVGKRLDKRYEIQELIGVGGMSMVYKAYDQLEEKTVALKVLKDEFLSNKDFTRRFKNESKAISILSHPNIVKVENVSFGDKMQYIVMEYIDGITLAEYIQNHSQIKWQKASGFICQILKALEHAHDKDIVHRDMKPQNIMILPDRTVKVTDFGIARFTGQKSTTLTEKTIGSVHYISPEQAKGDIVDDKADLYSVGAIFYEMLTGKLPFEAETAVSVALMQVQVKPKPPRENCENIPIGLEEIIMKAMEKDKMRRFSSAKEMMDAIVRVKQNPHTTFNYSYFSDKEITKRMDPIKQEDLDKNKDYGDNYVHGEEKYEDISSPDKKWFRAMIAIGISTLVFLLGFGCYALFGYFASSAKDVDVPNFIGKKISEIQASREYKFSFEVEPTYDPDKPEGVVVDQDPKPNSKKIKEDAKINLKVNGSPVQSKVPTVRGLSEESARAKLKEAGFSTEVLGVEDNEVPKNIVIRADPEEGSLINSKSTVKIFVSKGAAAKKIRVPDVTGLDRATAIERIVASGLKISEKIAKKESDKASDTVLSTDPAAGSEVGENTTIQLTVSFKETKKKEKLAEISVDLPSAVNHDVALNVYIDGVSDDSNSKKVKPSYNNVYKFQIKGTTGKKVVGVDLDGSPYRVYEVNFDSGQIVVKQKNQYVDPQTQAATPPSAN
ncbi:MAG: Stk1 family PASTA domain-containing Ser/Thr kinase [Oscillospiraceae bacterium]|jgi:serine/threonine-protein kinase|nr:Stk1 family PASTA domain-containing Ser/Thr kinase [Oscillospiraceae bacterium]